MRAPQSPAPVSRYMYRLSYGRPIYLTPQQEENGRLKLAVEHSCKFLPEGGEDSQHKDGGDTDHAGRTDVLE